MSRVQSTWIAVALLAGLCFGCRTVWSSPILTGKIEHSKVLPPVAPALRAGNRFDARSLPAEVRTALWWKVPAWMAGTWMRSGPTTMLYNESFVTGRKSTRPYQYMIHYVGSEIFGHQRDAHGEVWNCSLFPYQTEDYSQEGGWREYVTVKLNQPVEVSDALVVLRFCSQTVRMDPATGRIISVTQDESLQTYTPESGGALKSVSSIKHFDENGKAVSISRLVTHRVEVNPFRVIDRWPPDRSVNLRRSFREFLIARGLTNLIPEDE